MARGLPRLLLVAILCASSASGCAPSTLSVDPVAPEITVILESSTASLNPYSLGLAQRRLGHLVFQGLLSVGPDMMPQPDLCAEVPTTANGGISADGTVVTYRLKDATFHDGTAVTARDVVFTIEQLRTGELVDEPGVDMSVVLQAEALDERTVVVHLRRPDAGLVWRLAPFVLPAHLLEDSPDLLSDPYWLSPIGSGRYRVADASPGASVRLRLVEGATGPASLDVAFVADQSAARMIFDDAPYAVWPDAPVDPVGAAESVVATQSAVWWRLGASPTADSLSSRLEVRAVVRLVVERHLVDPSGEPPGLGPYGRSLARSSIETTQQAAALLASTGWRVASDGVRERSGRRLEALLRLPAQADPATVDAIRAEALSMGMLLEVRPSGVDYYGNFNEGGVLARAKGDFFVTAMPVGAPPGYAWPYRPDDVPSFENPSGLNWQRLTDARAAAWTSRIMAAGSPEDAATALLEAWAELNKADELAWLYPETERALVKRVSGVSAHPVAEAALTGCGGWTIQQ